MANKTILLKRSSVVNEDGTPKSPNNLEYGEVALNYAENNETLFIKNSANRIIGISISGNTQTAAEALAAHEARNDNPHGVTKEQVGLGNVDNTADIDKPVSTAQAAALALKLDKTSVVDNLTSNDSTKPLSAAQGIALNEKLKTVSGGASADLSALLTRVSSLEEEVNGTVAQCDAIIARELEIKNEFSE